IPLSARARDDGAVQVITSSRASRPPLGAVVVGLVVGSVLLVGGLLLAWVAFATPVLTGLTPPTARPGPAQLALGGVIWGFTLVAPPSFAIVGALRLGRVVRAISVKPRTRAMTRVAAAVGDQYSAATDVRLPDGRIVRDLVLGPFGLAVINELPPPRATRHTGISWEIRRSDGRWVHFENPLERTARDGERVRRWIASTERDFVVKVYAAVVTPDPTISRTPGCAVLTPEQIPAWLASLPSARALTADRQVELVEAIRTIV
ncbi:MAG TPA: hypothetical protein VHM48_11565, partial [Candidatus Limnocylindrales bacterium]|nr:hypothetical protein [Candidatus Limnocylindrales bacterium]